MLIARCTFRAVDDIQLAGTGKHAWQCNSTQFCRQRACVLDITEGMQT